MHEKQIRNLPVVDDEDQFVGLFGIRPLIRMLLPTAGNIKHGLKDLSFMPDNVGDLYDRLEKVSHKPVSDYLEKKKHLTFCRPSTTFPEVLELLDQSPDTSLPVIVVKGKRKKLVGMVSAWDVLEKLVMNAIVHGDENGAPSMSAEPDNGEQTPSQDPSNAPESS